MTKKQARIIIRVLAAKKIPFAFKRNDNLLHIVFDAKYDFQVRLALGAEAS